MTLKPPFKHLAVIMDGNRRWAKARGLFSVEGHRQGVKALRLLVKDCLDLGIPYLTAYAFSSENWKRTAKELNFLFDLLNEAARDELNSLQQMGVRVKFIGDLSVFQDSPLFNSLINLEKATEANHRLFFNIALNYGSIAELTRAVNLINLSLDDEGVKKLSPEDFNNYLYTKDSPDPDYIIRTGGKQRLSNYLLWQAVYAKLIFTETFWPDFKLSDLGLNFSKSAYNLIDTCS